MKKTALLLFFLAFILCGFEAFSLELHIAGDKISVQADNEPLRNILQALANQGISIRADPGINPFETVSFKNREIDQGLKIIFRDLNYTLIWKTIDTPAGQFVRLEEIHLFIPGKKDLTKILSPDTGRLDQNPNDGSVFIKNEILIRLSKEIDLTKFKKFLLKNGLVVSGYNRITGIIKIILPEKSDYFPLLALINNYPGVEKAEPNYAYPVNRPFFTPGAAGETLNYKAGSPSGKQPPIAVIDSGLSGDYLSAPYVYASFNCLDPNKPLSDSLGHGTQMAMIAGGAVKPIGTGNESGSIAPVIAIKGFDEDGYISNFNL